MQVRNNAGRTYDVGMDLAYLAGKKSIPTTAASDRVELGAMLAAWGQTLPLANATYLLSKMLRPADINTIGFAAMEELGYELAQDD